MIDLHSHIIPGVDDGSNSLQETIKILKLMKKRGLKSAAATPHYPIYNNQNFKKEIFNKVEILKKEVKKNNLAIEIFTGAEIMINRKLPLLYYQDKLLTINNTDYLLLEFRLNIYPEYLAEVIYDLKTMGLKIIIAHPERYLYVQTDYSKIYQWLEEYDLKIMLNSSSLTGAHGVKAKKTAEKLIEKGLCHLIGSDTHGIKKRPFSLDSGLKEAEKIRSGSAEIFKNNAEKVIKNQALENFKIKKEDNSLIRNIFSFFNK